MDGEQPTEQNLVEGGQPDHQQPHPDGGAPTTDHMDGGDPSAHMRNDASAMGATGALGGAMGGAMGASNGLD
jgi:calmodulin